MSALPRLDDRSYDELLAEARALIPAHAPEWTDHNPSDPGVALLELFAWLAEMLLYRADQIPDGHRLAFVRLLRGPDWTPDPARSTAEEIDAALGELRERWRAVTPEDYEAIAPGAAPDRIALAHCVARRDLAADPIADAPGAVSVIILPALEPWLRVVEGDDVSEPGAAVRLEAGTSLWVGAASPFAGVRVEVLRPGANYDLRVAYHDGAQWRPFKPEDGTEGLTRSGTLAFTPPAGWAPRPEDDPPRFWLRLSAATEPATVATLGAVAPVMPTPDSELVRAVREHLEPRRILTTRPVVLGAAYVPVGFDVLLARLPGSDAAAVHAEAARRLQALLDPLTGGLDGAGWPLGRSVYLGELEQLLDDIPGVDHVPDVLPAAKAPAAQVLHPSGDVIGLSLGAHRLPDARVDPRRIVSGTRFVSVEVTLAVEAATGIAATTVRAAVKAAVRRFFHPLSGGPTGAHGEDYPVADLELVVRDLPEVTAASADVRTVPDRMTRDSAGLPVLALLEGELVEVTSEVRLAEL